jgi:mono/diheme cytochrome c family protein
VKVRAGGIRARRSTPQLLGCAALCWLAACGSAGTASPPSSEPPAEATASEPVASAAALATFTAEQADRGERVFTSVCSVCHGRNEFRGPIFSLTWRVEPVGHLFEHISATMPQDNPGSLAPDEYASIVAYMLRLNGRRPGRRELPADAEALNELSW